MGSKQCSMAQPPFSDLFDEDHTVERRQLCQQLGMVAPVGQHGAELTQEVRQRGRTAAVDLEVKNAHALRAQVPDDGAELFHALDLEADVHMVCAAGHAPLERRQRVHTRDHEEHADERAGIKPRADGKAETRARPESGSGGQALDLLAGGDDDRARAEKADALCGLGAEARHVLRRADALGERAPRSVEHLVELQAQQHGERRAERREHIGAKAGGAVFALALKPDQPAAEHGEEDAQHHRDDIQFTQVGEYGRHGCGSFLSCSQAAAARLAGAAAHDQAAAVFHAVDRLILPIVRPALNALEQQVEGALAVVECVVFHTCELDALIARARDVIKAAETEILRHAVALAHERVEHAVGHHVIDGDDAGDLVVAQTFIGQLHARAVLQVGRGDLRLERVDVRADGHAALRTPHAVGLLQALCAAHAGDVVLVERRGQVGDALVAEADEVLGHELRCAEVIDVHGVDAEVNDPVADGDDGHAAAQLAHLGRLRRRHGEDDAGHAREVERVEQMALCAGVPIGVVDRGLVAGRAGRSVDAGDHHRVIGIRDRRGKDRDLSAGAAGRRCAVADALRLGEHARHALRGKALERLAIEDHGDARGRNAGRLCNVAQGGFAAHRHLR